MRLHSGVSLATFVLFPTEAWRAATAADHTVATHLLPSARLHLKNAAQASQKWHDAVLRTWCAGNRLQHTKSPGKDPDAARSPSKT